MKLIVMLVLSLIIFLFVVAFLIAPNQGGYISSTQINASALQNTSSQYQENIPIQEVDLSSSGRSIFIAVTMLTHVAFANVQIGGSIFALLAAVMWYRTGQKRFSRIGRSVALFCTILFAVGATFAGAAMFFFIGLFPKFSMYEFHVWYWPLFAEAILFGLQIFFLPMFWYTWGKIRPAYHLALGGMWAVSIFFQYLMINTLAAGMLTPGVTSISFTQNAIMPQTWDQALAMWFNPTVFRLQFHRLFGAMSFFGFLVALLAVFHYWERGIRRASEASKRYFDWVASFGIAFGLIGFMFQIPTGLTYMFGIMGAEQPAFEMIMHGPRAWEMLTMVGFLSLMMMGVTVYYIDRRERLLSMEENRILYRVFQVLLIASAISGFILVNPGWWGATFSTDPAATANFLGNMDYKYPALFTLVIVAALILMVDIVILGDRREAEWGRLSKASQSAAVFVGFLGTWILFVMGYVRESARSPFTIYGIIPVPGGQAYPTPIPLSQIFIVWLVMLGLIFLVLWFVSRVTSGAPEADDTM